MRHNKPTTPYSDRWQLDGPRLSIGLGVCSIWLLAFYISCVMNRAAIKSHRGDLTWKNSLKIQRKAPSPPDVVRQPIKTMIIWFLKKNKLKIEKWDSNSASNWTRLTLTRRATRHPQQSDPIRFTELFHNFFKKLNNVFKKNCKIRSSTVTRFCNFW